MELFRLLFCAANIVSALPFSSDEAVGIVWQFPNETWIENLAIRQTGEILATSLDRGALYLVDPFAHTSTTVHDFGAGVLGITEIERDVFLVLTADVNLVTSTAIPGSGKAWRVDMAGWTLNEPNAVLLISVLAEIGLPDGVVVPSGRGMVLIADAGKGLVWRLETVTGDYAVAIDDPVFKAASDVVPLGVDGLRVIGNQLYFTNPSAGFLGRVTIDASGSASGAVEVVANLSFPDDFALTADGTAYVVGANTLSRVSPNGSVNVIAGGLDNATLEGATSAQLGRTPDDAAVLYISTNGGQLAPVGGQIIGGQILAINVALFR